MPLSFAYVRVNNTQHNEFQFPAPQRQVQVRIVSSRSLGLFSDDSHGAIAKAAAGGIKNDAIGDPLTSNFVYMLREQWITDKASRRLLPVYFLGYKGSFYSLAFGPSDKPKKLKKLGMLQPSMLKPTVIPAPINAANSDSVMANSAPSPSAIQPGQANSQEIYWNAEPAQTSDVQEAFYM